MTYTLLKKKNNIMTGNISNIIASCNKNVDLPSVLQANSHPNYIIGKAALGLAVIERPT